LLEAVDGDVLVEDWGGDFEEGEGDEGGREEGGRIAESEDVSIDFEREVGKGT